MLFLQMAAGTSKKPILILLGILAFIDFDGLYAHIWTPWPLKYLPYHEGSCASKLNHPNEETMYIYCSFFKVRTSSLLASIYFIFVLSAICSF